LPLAAITSTIALFENLGFQLPTGKAKTVQDKSLLIWGGASSVGSILLQFATFLGFTVYTTASSVHHEYLKGLGATAVFDYRSPGTIEDIVSVAKHAGKPIAYAVDTVSEAETLKSALEVLEQSGGKGSKLAFLAFWPEDQMKPDGLEISHVAGESIRGDRKDLSVWLFDEFLTKALEEGTIVPSPKVKVVDGGLGSLQTALDLLKEGVHGEKLVVKLD
jgi:NADPH:quinone reductase-like Zn-dependent oxidoreductase